MNLRSEILAEHSKAQTKKIIEWVGNSQQRFDELINLFLGDEYRITQRAGWPLSYIAIDHPQLVKKHLPVLVKTLRKENLQNAVKRNIVRFLQEIPISKKLQGDVMDCCFRFISDPVEVVAVKAFSLTILEKLARDYPEIKNELKIIIEERWPYETSAFHSRARKILKSIT